MYASTCVDNGTRAGRETCKCHDAGKFVAASLRKKPVAAAAGKCRDKTTKKFAKCSAPNTEPLPK
jgi:hypothetical protein